MALARPGEEVVVPFGDDLGEVRRLRHLTADVFGSVLSDERRADVVLVVSELVTNALLHAPGPRCLRLRRTDDGVDVEVEDASPTLTRLAQEPTGVTGRGRLLVHRLADVAGVHLLPHGKRVWCHLQADPPR